MYKLTEADRVWNRACGKSRLRTHPGDRALADLLQAHNLAMNGGVLHAVEVLTPQELSDAQSGYRFYGLDGIASLLSRAKALIDAGQDLGFHEAQLDRQYAEIIPDDGFLGGGTSSELDFEPVVAPGCVLADVQVLAEVEQWKEFGHSFSAGSFKQAFANEAANVVAASLARGMPVALLPVQIAANAAHRLRVLCQPLEIQIERASAIKGSKRVEAVAQPAHQVMEFEVDYRFLFEDQVRRGEEADNEFRISDCGSRAGAGTKTGNPSSWRDAGGTRFKERVRRRDPAKPPGHDPPGSLPLWRDARFARCARPTNFIQVKSSGVCEGPRAAPELPGTHGERPFYARKRQA